ncbi:MAG: hypothetical protein MPJ22_07850 [Pirellulales bacterium]|nr:hypothetical protein [Pirellulales bacterium]
MAFDVAWQRFYCNLNYTRQELVFSILWNIIPLNRVATFHQEKRCFGAEHPTQLRVNVECNGHRCQTTKSSQASSPHFGQA